LQKLKCFLSKKYLIIFGLMILILLLVIIYQYTSLWEPEQSLLTLLPDVPIGYVSVKMLEDVVETFNRSEFGKSAVKMPILTEVQRQLWWRVMVYQKRLWEHRMGGKLDFKTIKGYLGEEALVAFYKRGEEVSVLAVSALGAKEKLEVAAITAADPVNPNYKRIREDYGGFTINTITGYPRDFSYAFIGRIGLLALDPSLIKDAIDIYAGRKSGFANRYSMGKYLQQQYDTSGSTVYIDFPRLTQAFEFDEQFRSLFRGIGAWTFSNRYEQGIIHSEHRIIRNEYTERTAHVVGSIDQHLLSVLPATTALVSVTHQADASGIWDGLNANLAITVGAESRPRVSSKAFGADISRHLGTGFTVALLAPTSDTPMVIPSIILAFPIKDRNGLNAVLVRHKQNGIRINGKPLRFLTPQDYQGVSIQPVQFKHSFLLSPTGGYTIVNDYWIISTTVAGLRFTIDTAIGNAATLGDVGLCAAFNHPKASHVLIQPNYLVPEVKRFVSLSGLILSASGQQGALRFAKRVTDNVFPLETLGAISAGIDSDGKMIDVEMRIVLEKQ
jgi:hypothetical protein